MKSITPTAMLVFIAAFAFAPSVLATGAGEKTTMQDLEKEAGEFIETLRGYGADQRNAAIEKAAGALRELDRRIEALETHVDENWDQMNQTARQQARATLRALREQRIRVAKWYGSLESSSASAWSHMKNGFSNAYRDLHDAWVKSKREFDSTQ